MAWPALPGQGNGRKRRACRARGRDRNKAATDRAAKLDSDIAAFREKIEKAGPVLEANSQGNALARLFNLPEAKAATLSTYQNLAMAMVIELLIVISLVATEVLEHHETKTPAPEATPIAGRPSLPVEQSRQAAHKPVEAAPVMTALSYDEEPKAFPAPPRPRLIASRPDPVGSVAMIMAEIMEPGRGKVEIADVFAAYSEACQASGKRPIPANEFPAAIAALCERLGIQIEANGKGVFPAQGQAQTARACDQVANSAKAACGYSVRIGSVTRRKKQKPARGGLAS